MTNQQLAYVLARITLGLNFLLHGLVRIPKLNDFANQMASGFENTMLPELLVIPFLYALPFLEFLIGLFILLGIKTRESLTTAAILIMLLIFGSALKADWGAVGTQMLYALFTYFLIFHQENNRMGLTTKKKN